MGLETPFIITHHMKLSGSGKWKSHIFEVHRKNWEKVKERHEKKFGTKTYKDFQISNVETVFSIAKDDEHLIKNRFNRYV